MFTLKPKINYNSLKLSLKPLALMIIAVFFVFSNIINIVIVSVQTGDLAAELIKWLQLASLLFLLSFLLKNAGKKFAIPTLALLMFFYYILVLYFMTTNIKLDFSFLRRSLLDINSIVRPFISTLIILVPVALLNAFFFITLTPSKKLFQKIFITLAGIMILVPLFFSSLPANELIIFAKTIYQRDSVINHYQQLRANLINKSIANKNYLTTLALSHGNKERPTYLDNIIILQIESLNKRLVGTATTPNYLKFAEEGVYFPDFYSNSVQTIFGQENILCSLPTSFDLSLVQSEDDKNITCLPAVLDSLGYKTFFLKSYDLGFTDTGKFMKNIGFEEVRADSIMDPGDPQYKWGYREDVFYNRAFEYIEKQKQERLNFFYIEIGPTNHWPFSTPNDYQRSVPYPTPQNHQERLANTTYIQDSYLPVALESIEKMFPEKNYTILILSDHTWPTGTHKNNVFNQQGAFEDNFLSSMAMRIGTNEEYKRISITTRYSTMDIMPSLLDLLGVEYLRNNYSRSFVPELNGAQPEKNKTLLIQPYSVKQIGIVENYSKTRYQADIHSLFAYDLLADPDESFGRLMSSDKKENYKIMSTLIPLVDNNKVIMHALGGIDGHDYTNSLEAFLYHYQRGRRNFEIDLTLNTDGNLIASHNDDQKAENLNTDEFKNTKILNKYTSLDFNDILLIMKEYPDIKIIVDMKNDFLESYKVLVSSCRTKDPNILKRIIPQIYHEHELDKLTEIHDFDEIIYTLHRAVTTPKNIVAFSLKHPEIKKVTLSKAWFSRQLANGLHDIGKTVFIHTVNKTNEINFYLQNGVDGIYTDFY